MAKRREMAYEGKVDWAFGELLALGTFLAQGKLIRSPARTPGAEPSPSATPWSSIQHTGAEFTPLELLTLNPDGTSNGGRFLIYDSPLSEYAAVGFEYGYSVGNPNA